MTEPSQNLDLVWGAEAIADVIGRTRRQTQLLLEKGELPPAKKLNGRWVASRAALRRFFDGEKAA